MVVVVKEWSLVGSQKTQEEVEGVSIEEGVQPGEGSEEVVQLSSQPAKAFPFQVMASHKPSPVLPLKWRVQLLLQELQLVVLATGSAELGQSLERRLCFLHNLKKRSHCWSQFLFWVHLQCWKFQTEELFVVVVVVAVAEAVVSPK